MLVTNATRLWHQILYVWCSSVTQIIVAMLIYVYADVCDHSHFIMISSHCVIISLSWLLCADPVLPLGHWTALQLCFVWGDVHTLLVEFSHMVIPGGDPSLLIIIDCSTLVSLLTCGYLVVVTVLWICLFVGQVSPTSHCVFLYTRPHVTKDPVITFIYISWYHVSLYLMSHHWSAFYGMLITHFPCHPGIPHVSCGTLLVSCSFRMPGIYPVSHLHWLP
mgnify:CR=1 FL=1